MQSLEVIEGGRVKRKLPLNDGSRRSIATRFLDHGASLSTLAWETGHSQHRLCEVIVEVVRMDGVETGRKIERLMGRSTRSLPMAA